MARLARVEVFESDEVAIVHVLNRTVRRCFLLGNDPVSGGGQGPWGAGTMGTPTNLDLRAGFGRLCQLVRFYGGGDLWLGWLVSRVRKSRPHPKVSCPHVSRDN